MRNDHYIFWEQCPFWALFLFVWRGPVLSCGSAGKFCCPRQGFHWTMQGLAGCANLSLTGPNLKQTRVVGPVLRLRRTRYPFSTRTFDLSAKQYVHRPRRRARKSSSICKPIGEVHGRSFRYVTSSSESVETMATLRTIFVAFAVFDNSQQPRSHFRSGAGIGQLCGTRKKSFYFNAKCLCSP